MTGRAEGGELTLFLDGCCIQTAALRAYQGLHGRLLAAEGDVAGPEAESLERLRRFLAATDFAALRARRPDLDGRVRARVTLFFAGDAVMLWTEPDGG